MKFSKCHFDLILMVHYKVFVLFCFVLFLSYLVFGKYFYLQKEAPAVTVWEPLFSTIL